MTARELPREEFDRLVGTELETIADSLPDSATVLVVEEGDQIVACWSVCPIVHVEGLWISPRHKSATRRLWRTMRTFVQETFGTSTVATSSCSDVVSDFLQRVGAYPVAGKLWMLPLKGRI